MRRREFLGLGGLALALPSLAQAEELLSHLSRPQNWAPPTTLFDRGITPTSAFFVRSHFGAPSLRRNRRLRIDGLVERPLDLSVADLGAFPEVSLTSVLQCAGNGRSLHRPRVPGVQWVHGAMGQARWTGVRLADLLAKAGVKPGAKLVRLVGADRPPRPQTPAYVRGLPIERALDPTTLVAHGMNGEPLTLAHGAPLRLVVPGWTGNHWLKWLTQITVQADEPEGFYAQTAYRLPKQPVAPGAAVPPSETRPVTTFPVKSIIARPVEGSAVPAGPQELAGIAFSGEAAIARVEISLDDGQTWQAASLEGEGGPGRWQVFRHRFTVEKPGPVKAMARATDGNGAVQPRQAAWNPSGYLWNACHAVAWTVTA